jgi:hypothetical protein
MTETNIPDRPLWQRLMLRRLKMLLVLVGAIVVIGAPAGFRPAAEVERGDWFGAEGWRRGHLRVDGVAMLAPAIM